MSEALEFVAPRPVRPRRRYVGDIWHELGTAMRALREAAGVSLRQTEAASNRSRGQLSQIERGVVKPTRELVEWYDQNFHADGALLALFAEAIGAAGGGEPARSASLLQLAGDEFEVVSASPALGLRVAPAAELTPTWTLRNAGSVPWRGRRLARLGAIAGPRLLQSPAFVAIADTAPGALVTVSVPVTVPSFAASFVAYWQLIDSKGRRSFGDDRLLSIAVVADW